MELASQSIEGAEGEEGQRGKGEEGFTGNTEHYVFPLPLYPFAPDFKTLEFFAQSSGIYGK
jgi:hypothetical protein